LALQDNPGEIKPEAIERLHAMVLEKLTDRGVFARWFGQYSSTRKYPEIDWSPDDEVDADQIEGFLSRGLILQRNPASRFSFMEKDRDSLVLFCDGEMFDCSGDAAALGRQIGGAGAISIAANYPKSDQLLALVTALYNQGSLSFEPE
jgi:50S ribosomal protein L16 3-hydroxylase